MAADQKLQQIVERMVVAGESEADIASVIQHYKAQAPAETPKPEGKSVGGFLSNALTSTGRLLKDTATGAVDLAKFGATEAGLLGNDARTLQRVQAGEAVRNAPQIAKAVGGSLKGRYIDNLGDTLYEDPAGVAADVSMLLSGGGAAAARAPKLAGMLTKAGAATNPLRVLEPAAKGLEYGLAGANRLALAPPTAMIRQQRAPLEIERTALKTGAVTRKSAGKKLGDAKAQTDAAAAAATARGATVPRDKITQFPKTLEDIEDVTPNVRELDDLAAFEKEAQASLSKQLTPDELLRKRRAQDRAVDKSYRAEEKGGYIRGVKDKGQKEVADNMRQQFREMVPEAAGSDDLARRLGLVRGSLKAANERPKSIPMGGALVGGGTGAVFGGPAGAAAGSAFGLSRLFPQIPLALSSPPVRAASAAAAPASQQGLLLAALLERLMGDDQ
jgi:hypothetical protein